MIVCVGGIKGGVGKTTISTNLAVMRQGDGRRVILIDADEQRSAMEFSEQRAALGHARLECVAVSGKETLGLIRDLSGSYEDIIVDVGGRDTTAQRAALIAADMALLPFAVGSFDAWTLPQVETLISEVRRVNASLDAVAFVNRGYVSGPDNDEASSMLRGSTVLRFVDTPIIERRIYARSAGEGLSVSEVKGSQYVKARSEIAGLYRAVFDTAVATAA